MRKLQRRNVPKPHPTNIFVVSFQNNDKIFFNSVCNCLYTKSTMNSKLTLKKLNELTPREFHEIFANVIERWPEGAIYVSALLPFNSIELLLKSFEKYVLQLSIETKVKILRLHPDLAGKLADSGNLTAESTYEQSCAGLNELESSDKMKLNELNKKYKCKFNFPFVICVRETNKFKLILREIEQRLNNSEIDEINLGIDEVIKICNLRIMELVDTN